MASAKDCIVSIGGVDYVDCISFKAQAPKTGKVNITDFSDPGERFAVGIELEDSVEIEKTYNAADFNALFLLKGTDDTEFVITYPDGAVLSTNILVESVTADGKAGNDNQVIKFMGTINDVVTFTPA